MMENAGYKILIVEDNLLSQKLLAQLLLAQGFEIIDTASDGLEGLEKLHNKKYDLIFFDLMMPNMDGLQFIQRAKNDSNSDHAAFVLVSAELEDKKLLEIIEAGAISYVSKPITPDYVKKVVAQFHRWLNAQAYNK